MYTLYVKTGSFNVAGTDAMISATLSDAKGKSVHVQDLRSWGLIVGPTHEHDYFERDSLDIFTGRGPCIAWPVCRLNLTSNGGGTHPGWFCDHVEVTSTGPHKGCSKTLFHVEQWLSYDSPPYDLTAVIDGCGWVESEGKEGGRFVVGKEKSSSWE